MISVPKLMEIPAGPVALGAPDCPVDYSLRHRWPGSRTVALAAFRIGVFPVTRREYEAFLSASGASAPADWDDPLLAGPDLPVCGVSWEDADAYCRWLAAGTGTAFRLPSADEWEKAARGGLIARRFPWGDEDPRGRCCFGRPAEAAPQPVGSYAANGYGLYDMVGNVWEWLSDRYVDVAADAPVNTPTGKPAECNRVLVGGSFMTPSSDALWVAYRHEDPPDLRHRCLGFRVAV